MEFKTEYFTKLAETGVANIRYPETTLGLYEPIRYAMSAGGKRIRPALTLAVYAALSGREPKEIINQAVAVEMFHNFTLLHDDVMDNADMRRGLPTVHKKWDENTAILSGDTMLSMAYGLLADGAGERFGALFEVFNRTAIEVYEGQQLDMEFESRRIVTVDEYMEMIRLKTSVLLGCACRIGAMLAGASDDVCNRFYEYGISLGLAFQLRDDWLDTFGDPAVFGKEIGGDILNEKKTWLLITSLAEAEDEVDGILRQNLEPEQKIGRVTRVYNRLGLSERCAELISRHSDEAVESIADVPMPVEARNYFKSLALQAESRTH